VNTFNTGNHQFNLPNGVKAEWGINPNRPANAILYTKKIWFWLLF